MNKDDFERRIKKRPEYHSWINADYGFEDHISDRGEIDYSDLGEKEKMCLYVYAWNLIDIFPGRKSIMKAFGWSAYKLKKIRKELENEITTCPTFNMNSGLLNGKGYFFNAQ